jgi:N4-gp56 family major capsid protein
MSEVTLASASEKQIWINKYFAEYVRISRFLPYMSNADLNKGGIILSRYELQSDAGKTINIPFIGRLKSNGVTGSTVLDGNEEELTNYNMPITVDWRRNGVRVPKSTSFKTEINLLNAGRDALVTWEAEKLRNDIIKAMMAMVTDTSGTTVNLADSSTANRNAFAAANSDRILAGAVRSNYNATWATMVGTNLDSPTDKCTAAAMSLAKRMAKSADPHIRPFRVDDGDGREFYVCFHGSRTFRDLKADTTIVTANTDARAREGNGMDKNPIFQDGDIMYDGLIHREVPEIDDIASNGGAAYTLDGAGSGSADVRPVFLCGGGSVGIAWGQEPTPRSDYIKDYGFRPGVAIEELVGVKKINYNGVQNGIVTCLFTAAADS